MTKELVGNTDPGIDDTLALIYLENSSEVKITEITTVPGNTTSEKVLRNANYIAEIADIEANVYRGSEKPINRDLKTATSHGESGLGAMEPSDDYSNSEGKSVDALIENADKGKHLLALGPLTNIARAIEKEENILEKYKSVTIMGGGISYGNHTRFAEFNFWVDPEAAEKVIQASGEKRIVPGDVCYSVQLDFKQLEDLNLDGELGKSVSSYIEQYQEWGYDGGVMYDPLAAVLALNPHYGDIERMDLRVESEGKYTRGTVVPQDNPGAEKDPNSVVYRKVDKNQVTREFIGALN